MARTKVKTRAQDLARMRNNQRNSRSRRQEYIRSLETKVQECERERDARLAELQRQVELLGIENQLLKYFAESVSSTVGLAEVSTLPFPFPREEKENRRTTTLDDLVSHRLVEPSWAGATDELQDLHPEAEGTDHWGENNAGTSDVSFPDTFGLENSLIFPPPPLFPADISEDTAGLLFSLPQIEPEPEPGSGSSKDWSAPKPTASEDTMTDSTPQLAAQDTIPCSMACELLVSYTRRNPDLLSLHFRLRSGYRNNVVPGEGCRVDSQVLLTVLAECA